MGLDDTTPLHSGNEIGTTESVETETVLMYWYEYETQDPGNLVLQHEYEYGT